jgi:hypothetical protein
MMDGHPAESTEALLNSEARAGLPLRRLLRLYLDPGALFKDATSGSWLAREQARRYNARYRWMLLAYVRRWMALALLFFAGVGGAESLGGGQPVGTMLAASLAVAFCIAITVSFQTFVAYLLLGAPEAPHTGPR